MYTAWSTDNYQFYLHYYLYKSVAIQKKMNTKFNVLRLTPSTVFSKSLYKCVADVLILLHNEISDP